MQHSYHYQRFRDVNTCHSCGVKRRECLCDDRSEATPGIKCGMWQWEQMILTSRRKKHVCCISLCTAQDVAKPSYHDKMQAKQFYQDFLFAALKKIMCMHSAQLSAMNTSCVLYYTTTIIASAQLFVRVCMHASILLKPSPCSSSAHAAFSQSHSPSLHHW